jgi:hypothetical protein
MSSQNHMSPLPPRPLSVGILISHPQIEIFKLSPPRSPFFSVLARSEKKKDPSKSEDLGQIGIIGHPDDALALSGVGHCSNGDSTSPRPIPLK